MRGGAAFAAALVVALVVLLFGRKARAMTGTGPIQDEAQLKALMPNIPAARLADLPHLNAAMREHGITTPARVAAFVAQLGHESADLRYFEELASGAAYEGRIKYLGNTEPGDGKRYKGRGPIQLTGRANYRAAGRDLGLDLEGNPTMATDPSVGYRIAAWYWTVEGLEGKKGAGNLNELADRGDFDAITYAINGGYNGKADRDRRHTRALASLGSTPAGVGYA